MVYKAIKETKEEMVPHKYCDICGDEISISLPCSAARCMYCGKDLCGSCIVYEDDTLGDYRNVYCEKCWSLGESFRPEIEELHNKIESLYQEWEDMCKE